MTGFHHVMLAIELIEAGIRRPRAVARAAQITQESASNLIDALDGEAYGAMTEHTSWTIFPRSAERPSQRPRLN